MGRRNGGKGDPGLQRWGMQKAWPDYTARAVVRKVSSLAGPDSHHVMVWEVWGGKKTRGFKAVGELGPLGMCDGGCAPNRPRSCDGVEERGKGGGPGYYDKASGETFPGYSACLAVHEGDPAQRPCLPLCDGDGLAVWEGGKVTSSGEALPGWVNAVRVSVLPWLLHVPALTYCQSCCPATAAAAG